MSNTAAVTDHKEAGVTGLKSVINCNFHVVELDFNAVKQRVIVCGTWSDLIECIDHLNDPIQDTFGKHK